MKNKQQEKRGKISERLSKRITRVIKGNFKMINENCQQQLERLISTETIKVRFPGFHISRLERRTGA